MGLRYDVIQKVLLYRRIHDRNLSRHVELTQKDLLRAIRASVVRQRKSKEGDDGKS
jgi:hypothetical protein